MRETLHKGERVPNETYGDQVREAQNEPNGDLAMEAPCIGGREHHLRLKGKLVQEASWKYKMRPNGRETIVNYLEVPYETK